MSTPSDSRPTQGGMGSLPCLRCGLVCDVLGGAQFFFQLLMPWLLIFHLEGPAGCVFSAVSQGVPRPAMGEHAVEPRKMRHLLAIMTQLLITNAASKICQPMPQWGQSRLAYFSPLVTPLLVKSG